MATVKITHQSECQVSMAAERGEHPTTILHTICTCAPDAELEVMEDDAG